MNFLKETFRYILLHIYGFRLPYLSATKNRGWEARRQSLVIQPQCPPFQFLSSPFPVPQGQVSKNPSKTWVSGRTRYWPSLLSHMPKSLQVVLWNLFLVSDEGKYLLLSSVGAGGSLSAHCTPLHKNYFLSSTTLGYESWSCRSTSPAPSWENLW